MNLVDPPAKGGIAASAHFYSNLGDDLTVRPPAVGVSTTDEEETLQITEDIRITLITEQLAGSYPFPATGGTTRNKNQPGNVFEFEFTTTGWMFLHANGWNLVLAWDLGWVEAQFGGVNSWRYLLN